jgi:hypothetical protein
VSLQDEEGPGNAGAANDGTPAGCGSMRKPAGEIQNFFIRLTLPTHRKKPSGRRAVCPLLESF